MGPKTVIYILNAIPLSPGKPRSNKREAKDYVIPVSDPTEFKKAGLVLKRINKPQKLVKPSEEAGRL